MSFSPWIVTRSTSLPSLISFTCTNSSPVTTILSSRSFFQAWASIWRSASTHCIRWRFLDFSRPTKDYRGSDGKSCTTIRCSIRSYAETRVGCSSPAWRSRREKISPWLGACHWAVSQTWWGSWLQTTSLTAGFWQKSIELSVWGTCMPKITSSPLAYSFKVSFIWIESRSLLWTSWWTTRKNLTWPNRVRRSGTLRARWLAAGLSCSILSSTKRKLCSRSLTTSLKCWINKSSQSS